MPSSASPSSVAKVPSARRYGDQIGPLRRSSSRHATTAFSALRQAIVTGIEPRLSAISIVTRARITSIELAFVADLLVRRFFALAFILTQIIPEPRIFTKNFFRDRASQRWPGLYGKARDLSGLIPGGRVTLHFRGGVGLSGSPSATGPARRGSRAEGPGRASCCPAQLGAKRRAQ
jgi:hypothetical protein